MRILNLALICALTSVLVCPRSEASSTNGKSFVEQYPALKEYLFEEPPSGFQIGFGVSPFALVRNQIGLNASLFQLHWQGRSLDWEIFNASVGIATGGEDWSKSRQLVFRSSPKYRISQSVSIGPLLGYELVSFPNLESRIASDGLATPVQPFSSHGFIYGAEVSESFRLSKTLELKLSQVFYHETYSTTDAGDGWKYRFPQGQSPSSNFLQPGNVFTLDFSLIY